MLSVTRRTFLASSTLSLTGACAAVERGAVRPNERINVGLIGCGSMGRGDLRGFLMQPDVFCPVICDVDDAHLGEVAGYVEKAYGNRPDTVKDFRRVLDRADVDVVIVATPNHWHALPTVYACQAGKDVYVEKPLAKTIDEGHAMREAARRHRRVVQMGTQMHSGKHYRDAVEFVRSGKLGKLRIVRAWAYHYFKELRGLDHPPDGESPDGVDYDLWIGPAPKRRFNPSRFHRNWRWFWDYAGGLMTDWGVHLLDLCLWALDSEPPQVVHSSGGRYVLDDNTETPDTQVAVYEFPSCTLMFEHRLQGGVAEGARSHGMSFFGSEGMLIIDGEGWEVKPEPHTNALEPLREEAVGDGRLEHIRNFLDCVKSRQQPVSNLEVGHFVTSVTHLGNLAFRSGAPVRWDAEKERVEDNPEADELVGCVYRSPWRLPYTRRSV